MLKIEQRVCVALTSGLPSSGLRLGPGPNGENIQLEQIAINGGKGIVALQANDVVHLIWAPNARIEAVDAEAAMAAVNQVCNGTEHPMLVDMATTETLTREARAVWSRPCAAARIALLGSSPVDRVIANFFLGIHMPPCPTRFFTSRDEAISWLLQDDVP